MEYFIPLGRWEQRALPCGAQESLQGVWQEIGLGGGEVGTYASASHRGAPLVGLVVARNMEWVAVLWSFPCPDCWCGEYWTIFFLFYVSPHACDLNNDQ